MENQEMIQESKVEEVMTDQETCYPAPQPPVYQAEVVSQPVDNGPNKGAIALGVGAVVGLGLWARSRWNKHKERKAAERQAEFDRMVDAAANAAVAKMTKPDEKPQQETETETTTETTEKTEEKK